MWRVAAVQMAMNENREKNVDKALRFVSSAAQEGAHLILLPELFECQYFPQFEREENFELAQPVNDTHSYLGRFQELARKHRVCLPLSIFERDGPSYYNSLVYINDNGDIAGVYRKIHIPDGPSYEEKFYFAPGNREPRPWVTSKGVVGCGICWDQWFPELARTLALGGADIILYPTAIGSEPPAAGSLDTRRMWRTAMLGHAICNGVPVLAANRVGQEAEMEFYGHSFIADPQGAIIDSEDSQTERVLYADIEVEHWRRHRAAMGFFRDRRPELYGALLKREISPLAKF